jgi:hypothetical protein
LTLRNAIEGPIKLLAPPAVSVSADGKPVATQLRDAPTAFPLELKAGDSLQLTIGVGAPLTPGHFDVLVETQHSVASTGEDVLEAILDPQVRAQFVRKIAVKVPAGVFSARPAQAEPPLVAVEVVFETGASASFEAPDPTSTDHVLTQTVALPRPVVDYLLGRIEDGSYRYRIVWIYADGHRAQDDWRTDKSDSLFPDLIAPAYSGQG